MQSIQSPYVIGFQASFADEASVYIIMEYAERGSVSDQINSRRRAKECFEATDVWRCLVQVCCLFSTSHFFLEKNKCFYGGGQDR